jgi:hypothetical protein
MFAQVHQNAMCRSFFPCVLCRVHKIKEECTESCTALIIEEVDAIEGKFLYCEFLSMRFIIILVGCIAHRVGHFLNAR